MANEWLRYANQGATRDWELSPELINMLATYMPELGLTMEVFSGGQPASGPDRVGSHRHDYGNAADVFFYRGDRRLDWANPEDLPLFQQIVSQGRQAGITGFGAGEGYMQPGSMHLGLGSPSIWGAGGQGENAPDWLKDAYYKGAVAAMPKQYALPDDPRLDTPSSARQTGSALPGPLPTPRGPVGGPVEAAGGGAGSEHGQGLSTPYALPTAPQKGKKNFWEALGSGIEDAAGAMGKVQSPGYQIAPTPGAARVDVASAPMIDPQQAEMRRQQLAMAMAKLNQGSLW